MEERWGREERGGLEETKESPCWGNLLNFASFLFFNIGPVFDKVPVGMKVFKLFYKNK